MTNRGTWQPIETAPKDGSEILGGWLGYDIVDLIWWSFVDQQWRWNARESDDALPTHWMPLPAPPVGTDSQEPV